MRLLHIMASKAKGGAETYSTDVMLSLHREGVDQCVVMPQDAPRFHELEKAGLRMAPQIFSTPFQFLQKFLTRRLIAREKPDIVQTWMRRGAVLAGKGHSGFGIRDSGKKGHCLNPESWILNPYAAISSSR